MVASPLPPLSLRRHPKWKWPAGSLLLGTTQSGADVVVDAHTLTTHIHALGASGFGKSAFLQILAREIILSLDGHPRGLILLDPHGTLIRELLRWIASYKLDQYRRIHLIDPCGDAIVGINPVRHRANIDDAFVANTFANVVTSIWGDEEVLPQLAESIRAIGYTLCALGWTLLEAELLTDIADPLGVRQFIIDNVRHPQIRRFWQTIDALPPAKIEEKLGAAVRRLNSFLLPQALRRIFSQKSKTIDFRSAMDSGDILLIDLSYANGRISEDESSLLGRLILADIFICSLGRPPTSNQTFLMVDECQKYLTKDIASILDQSRKFNLSLVLAHQHLGHLREAGEHIFRSIMANARTKIVFGGLDDDDATFMARNLFRGHLPLETPKHTFDKPAVVGQDYDWLRSESTARGTARAEGTAWSEGESIAHSRSATTSWATTISNGDTTSQATTRSEAATQSSSDSAQWSHADSRSAGASASDTRSSSSGQSFSVNQEYWPYATTGSRLAGPADGATVSDGFTYTQGAASTTGRSDSWGSADSYGGASATGDAKTRGTADTNGRAHTHGVAHTEGFAITEGVTHSTSSSYGGSVTDTASRSATTGRGQSLRSVFATLPTQAYSLQELQYLGSALLGDLAVGEAIAKIGQRPPVRLSTIRIKPGWASEVQVEGLKKRLALASPFITPLPEARERYIAHRKQVMAQLLGVAHEPLPLELAAEPVDDDPTPRPPPLKEGWG